MYCYFLKTFWKFILVTTGNAKNSFICTDTNPEFFYINPLGGDTKKQFP